MFYYDVENWALVLLSWLQAAFLERLTIIHLYKNPIPLRSIEWSIALGLGFSSQVIGHLFTWGCTLSGCKVREYYLCTNVRHISALRCPNKLYHITYIL